jgi:hypothetical protein
MVPPGARNFTGITPGSLTISQPRSLISCGALRRSSTSIREVMDAGALARGLRFGGLRVRVVLHQSEVDLAVGHVARDMVAGLARLRVLESENLLVEIAGPKDVVDLQRNVDDAVHRAFPACRKGSIHLLIKQVGPPHGGRSVNLDPRQASRDQGCLRPGRRA